MPEPVGAGTMLTYTLSVANAGPSQANAISVTDTLPPGTVFLSATGTGWTCAGTAPVVCSLPALGITSAAPVFIAVTAPASPGPIVNTATVSSSTSDALPGNNTVLVISNVFGRADLSITRPTLPTRFAPVCRSRIR